MRFAAFLSSCATLFAANKAAEISSTNEVYVDVDATTDADAEART